MANLTTAQDIINSALRRAGELTDGNSEFESTAVELLNQMHLDALAGSSMFDIDMGDAFDWAKERNPGLLKLEPKYETGTISLTNGSASATLSTSSSDSRKNWYLRVEGDDTLYRVKNHSAGGTSVTLDQEYLGSTDSAANFSLYKLVYELESEILRLVGPMYVYEGQSQEADGTGDVSELSFVAFRQSWPLRKVFEGTPTRFTRIADDTDSQKISVRFNKVPKEAMRLEYDRIKFPSDLSDSSSDVPKLPREYRQALVFGIAYYILLEKNDDRANNYFGMTQRAFKAVTEGKRKEKSQTGKNYAQVIPRRDQMNRFRREFIAEADGET